MGAYAKSAEFYDLLYGAERDYPREAQLLAGLIRDVQPEARSILDVGCGTGAHARSLIDAGFEVDGVDLEPGLVDIATEKCPEGTFLVGDMTALELPGHYDAVVCLFSAIGYVRTESALKAAIFGMRSHLNEGGVIVLDPWFEPGELTDGWISVIVGHEEGRSACRMSRTVIDGPMSRLECEYLVGTPDGIERVFETHELGLFTQTQMEDAFRDAGLAVQRKPKELRTRGIYVGTPA